LRDVATSCHNQSTYKSGPPRCSNTATGLTTTPF
jgi:hypothetical protein